ncbi:hypothetical protein C2E25_00060 [Geothermobacter hydrogeniphilus]|uniref:Uncharacterized protein n=1 Tax=Geothermobacter hydrogeniphilus TaxID=1969733 RepID=A0A2K2HEK9_9BACT|nr:hypothetical protein [Geothermobacter hydrogeniphilus]PNU21661.1 hypothetical protein C2E25_00060 [Geothermobacter hydrogeniphilus]
MMIRIRYRDGRFDMVKANQIDPLLRSGKINAFRRADGWAKPGQVPLRGYAADTYYLGHDRRAPQGPAAFSTVIMDTEEETEP